MPNESVTIEQARTLLEALLPEQAVLLLSPPGVGKSDLVAQVAARAALPCRSLLGTQIAAEDVSGVPRIVGERTVFCPPRALLPDDGRPFCLFLDELPACAPDVQKAFYSLVLERRVGEHALPRGSWVVAAGNRLDDRALVRAPSSALLNRLIVIDVRADVGEWLVWASRNGVRAEIMAFVALCPDALLREPGDDPTPLSTPRSWTALSRALDKMTRASNAMVRAVAAGCLSPEDAASFCAIREEGSSHLEPVESFMQQPERMPAEGPRRWLYLDAIRQHVARGALRVPASQISRFFLALPLEQQAVLIHGLVEPWLAAGLNLTFVEHTRAA